jgi:RimJ/RimL family protein N-acetyltransferase
MMRMLGSDESRVRLANFEERHLAATLEWVNDLEIMRLLGRAAQVWPEEHRRWFEQLADRADCQYFAVERAQDDIHLGNIWLWEIDRRHRSAEVRVLMGRPDSTGHGLGTEAIDLLAQRAFNLMSLHRLYAYVLAINPRAKRSFEKAGFRPEGLLRADRWTGDGYVDVHVLGRLKEDAV